MKMLPVLFACSCIIAVCLFALFLLPQVGACGTGNKVALRTPTQTLSVVLAVTSEEQARGLGGCKMIPRKTGMYFPFQSQHTTFWMKHMVIPIDIVWISKGVVVGVDEHVPFPSPNTKDALLPLYKSPGVVDAVLEVGAGTAESYGLLRGAPVFLAN